MYTLHDRSTTRGGLTDWSIHAVLPRDVASVHVNAAEDGLGSYAPGLRRTENQSSCGVCRTGLFRCTRVLPASCPLTCDAVPAFQTGLGLTPTLHYTRDQAEYSSGGVGLLAIGVVSPRHIRKERYRKVLVTGACKPTARHGRPRKDVIGELVDFVDLGVQLYSKDRGRRFPRNKLVPRYLRLRAAKTPPEDLLKRVKRTDHRLLFKKRVLVHKLEWGS
jgi:hypothetical protein